MYKSKVILGAENFVIHFALCLVVGANADVDSDFDAFVVLVINILFFFFIFLFHILSFFILSFYFSSFSINFVVVDAVFLVGSVAIPFYCTLIFTIIFKTIISVSFFVHKVQFVSFCVMHECGKSSCGMLQWAIDHTRCAHYAH